LALVVAVFEKIDNFEKPVIAAVNGYAITGGFELAPCADIIIASERAAFADTHARLGLVPGGGNSQRLPRLVGIKKAKEILFTSNMIPAAEAERIGLVNRVVPADRLEEVALEMAQTIVAASQPSIRKIKAMINQGMKVDLGTGLLIEQVEYSRYRAQHKPEAVEAARRQVMERSRSLARELEGKPEG
jgi:enoyl-CoA hydratase/carnithine racemase